MSFAPCITASVGTNCADPLYDAVGNMTLIPQAFRPGGSTGRADALQYDAWNRVVGVLKGVRNRFLIDCPHDCRPLPPGQNCVVDKCLQIG